MANSVLQYTEQMEDALFEQWNELDEQNEDYQALIDFLNSDSFSRTFGNGLLYFLQRQKPELTLDTAIKYIETLCQETIVPVSAIASTNTLKNWFREGLRPKKGEDSRSSMFALAFALRLTPQKTADLFHHVYLDRAFDYRNEKEIIYYFCLQNKKSWSDATRLIESCTALDAHADDHTIYTAQIKIDIQELLSEEALLAYIAKHGHNLEKRNVSSHKNVAELIVRAKEDAEEETQLTKLRNSATENNIAKGTLYEKSPALEQFRNTDAKSLNHLYEVITGLHVRGSTGTKTLFKNARLPKEIKSRFPEAGTLSKKNPTYEELRKLIILLASYDYWYRAQADNVTVDIENYIEDLNVYLDESGMSLMYYGNPYDWLFLCCSLAERPLDTFRSILADVLE